MDQQYSRLTPNECSRRDQRTGDIYKSDEPRAGPPLNVPYGVSARTEADISVRDRRIIVHEMSSVFSAMNFTADKVRGGARKTPPSKR
ncbi:unnamed protein product [Heligmosomoides polygyrus]|uniref:Uncharacterized protein n=1 Tax=Heligmosomoides polygyrus TaxID=6339 RepID=A0A183FKA9_HELPZ|nr:unnamed protein product [Heligmosomoides polygyrus]